MVSWIAAAILLLYLGSIFLVTALDLHPLPGRYQRLYLFVAPAQHLIGSPLQPYQLVIVDVVALVLGEAMKENGAHPLAVDEKNPVPARAALAFAREPLLDNATTEIGINEATLSALDGIAQAVVINPLLAGKTTETLGREDSHDTSPRNHYL
jgi:hypothetical protein